MEVRQCSLIGPRIMNKSSLMHGPGKIRFSGYHRIYFLMPFCTTYNIFSLHLFRFKTQKKNLKIKPVMPDDTGIYICKGTNGFGSEEIRIDLIVIGKLKCFGYMFWKYVQFE